MLPIAVLGLAAAFVACAAGCERRAPGSRARRSAALVRVNGTELTKEDFDRSLPLDYGSTLTTEEIQDYLNRWVDAQVLYQEAVRHGLKISPDLRARVEQYQRELVVEEFVQKVIADRAAVSGSDVQHFYKSHRDQYATEYRVSDILVARPELADSIRGLLGTQSFESLAKRFSIDSHGEQGGDMGYLSRGNMIPEFEGVIYGMEVGEVSDVIATEFGYHLIKVTDIRESQNGAGYRDVEEEIRSALTLERRQSVYDSLVTALRSRAKIEFTKEAASLGVPGKLDSLAGTPMR